jgi:hypothetical protein
MTMVFRVAFFAFLASHQVRGLTPCNKKVATPARLIHIILVRNRRNAPAAKV